MWHKFYTTAGRDGRDKSQLWTLCAKPKSILKNLTIIKEKYHIWYEIVKLPWNAYLVLLYGCKNDEHGFCGPREGCDASTINNSDLSDKEIVKLTGNLIFGWWWKLIIVTFFSCAKVDWQNAISWYVLCKLWTRLRNTARNCKA